MAITPEQRAELLASGLTDAQIEAFDAETKAGAAPPVPSSAPTPFTGDDPFIEANPLLDPTSLVGSGMLPAGITRGAARFLGNKSLAPARLIGRSIKAIPRAAVRRAAGRENADDMIREIAGKGKDAVRTVPAKPPIAFPKPVKAKPPITRGVPKNAKPATPVTKPAAKVPAKPKAVSKPARPPITRHKPRGASAPELQRRTAARARATGKNPPAMGDQNMQAVLEQSLKLEAEMEARGLPQLVRQQIRNEWRQRMMSQ